MDRDEMLARVAARRTILEITGRLKPQAGDGLDALAEVIRTDLSRKTVSEWQCKRSDA